MTHPSILPATAHNPNGTLEDPNVAALKEALKDRRAQAPELDQRLYELYFKGGAKLPPMPKIATQLTDRLQNGETSITECVDLIELDPALASALLRCANSAAFFRGHRITGVRESVMRLGLREATCLALGLSLRAVYDDRVKKALEFVGSSHEVEWRRSAIVAHAAREISIRYRCGAPDMIYAAGLFHGVGRSLAAFILASLAMKDETVCELDIPERLTTINRMRSVLMGEYLLREGLPPELCQMCLEIDAPPEVELAPSTHAVRLTIGLVAGMMHDETNYTTWFTRALEAARILGMGRAALADAKEIVVEAREAVDALVG